MLININFLLVPRKSHVLAVVYSNNFQNKASEKHSSTPLPHMALYYVVYCAVSPTQQCHHSISCLEFPLKYE